jgi:hypothetical protein
MKNRERMNRDQIRVKNKRCCAGPQPKSVGVRRAEGVGTPLLQSIPIRSKRFGIEPELTIKLAKRQARIYETAISYHSGTYDEGRKILSMAFTRVIYKHSGAKRCTPSSRRRTSTSGCGHRASLRRRPRQPDPHRRVPTRRDAPIECRSRQSPHRCFKSLRPARFSPLGVQAS